MAEPRTGPTRTCEHCGASFRDFRKGRQTAFCSMTCTYANRVKAKDGDKPCSVCKKVLPVTMFSSAPRAGRPGDTYYRASCRDCRNDSRRALRLKSGESVRVRERDQKYGLQPGDFDKMLELQGGVCAVCEGTGGRSASGLYVDHNHETGFVRGLLCGKCNAGIGMLGDSVANLHAAADYISGWGVVCQAVDIENGSIQPRSAARVA